MKKIISILAFALFFFINANAQHAIRASRAVNHLREKVVVVDTIYTVNIQNDSTATIGIGRDANKTIMQVICNFKFDRENLKTAAGSVLEVTGFASLINNQPAIIVNDKHDLYFFSQSINQKWLAISQLPVKK